MSVTSLEIATLGIMTLRRALIPTLISTDTRFRTKCSKIKQQTQLMQTMTSTCLELQILHLHSMLMPLYQEATITSYLIVLSPKARAK